MVHCFERIIVSRGFHVYKKTTWSNAKVGDEVKVEVESNLSSIAHYHYSCAIKAKHEYFTGWKTVGHIPCEISQYVYFFIKKRRWKSLWKTEIVKIETVSGSFRRSGGPTVTQI